MHSNASSQTDLVFAPLIKDKDSRQYLEFSTFPVHLNLQRDSSNLMVNWI